MMRRPARTALHYAIAVVAIVLIVWAVRRWCIQSNVVDTNSMENSIYRNECILVNKLPVKNNPGRNRVVLFTSPLKGDSVNPPLFLSRCIGMPGDTILVGSESYTVNGHDIPRPHRSLNSYFVSNNIAEVLFQEMKEEGIPTRDLEEGTYGFTLTLTSDEETLLRKALPGIAGINFFARRIIPYQIIVPQKGRAYQMDDKMLTACWNAIMKETNGEAVVENGKLFIKGKEMDQFLFSEDYYWMLSDNVNDAVDSRKLGFVPASDITGNALFIWYSKDKHRIFRKVD